MRVYKKIEKSKYMASGLFLTGWIVFFFISVYFLWFEKNHKIFPATQHAALLSRPQQNVSSISQPPLDKIQVNVVQDDGLWDGPILYHEDNSEPIYLILIEKELQELSLFRYDGQYRKEKTYRCVTGKQSGDKQVENDDKTPEGIYFNNKTYRDKKITIFGDRAFGLNYPDIFDDLEGNGGGGIFLHGSNRDITPYSTNGCLVMDNDDLADLDKQVPLKTTPIIIGNRLPYRFSSLDNNLTRIVPFIKKTMLPKAYAKKDVTYKRFTLIGYQEQIVAMSIVQIDSDTGIDAISRVYFANPTDDFLVLLKREWNEEKKLVTGSHKGETNSDITDKARIESIIESWRSAWESKNLDAYISYYHPKFIDKGKNLKDWREYKQNLNNTYKKISVSVSNLAVKINGNKAMAYFQQHYKSESYEAIGYKRLELRKNNNTWKIFRERFFKRKPSNWPK